MTSRTVKTLYGETIEIVDDDDWALTAGVSLASLRMWDQSSKRFIVRELWEHGPATSTSGSATQVLYDRIVAHNPSEDFGSPKSITLLISHPTNAAAFEREVRGKRCFAIGLVALPECWARKLRHDIGGSMTTFAAIPISNGERPEVLEEPPLEEFETSPIIGVEIASQVAMELLTKVVEIIAAGSSIDANAELRRLRNDLMHSQGSLAQRLEENERLRKQIRETGDELHAIKLERDGLRQRLRQTEVNLNSALKGESAAAVTTEVMKRVDRIMRETPKPNQGPE